MRKRLLMLTAVLATFALVGAACGEDEPAATGETGPAATGPTFTTLEEGVLQAASCLDYPPFESVKGGVEVGFDVDLTAEIAGRLGLDVRWIKADFDTIFTAVAGDQFDVVAAAATILPEREEIVDFSAPYYNSRQSLTVNTVETPDIDSTDDLGEGDIVGSQKGTTGKSWAEENLVPQGVEIKTFGSSTEALRDLEAGNITAVVNDEPASIEIIKELPSLEVVQPIDTNEKYGFAFSPSNPELREAWDTTLAEVIADGTYETIFAKYFPGVEVPPEFQATA